MRFKLREYGIAFTVEVDGASGPVYSGGDAQDAAKAFQQACDSRRWDSGPAREVRMTQNGKVVRRFKRGTK